MERRGNEIEMSRRKREKKEKVKEINEESRD